MRPPAIVHQGSALPVPQSPGLAYTLAHLNPEEQLILIDGKAVSFSIELKVFGPIVGTDQYELHFATSKRRFRPFTVVTTGTAGELQFDGTVAWVAKSAGTTNTVTMALFRVERSQSGQTVRTTLLQEVRRTYQVVCDEHRFFLVAAYKRLFNLCRAPERSK
jgi:hypothetical protein